jgi:hypothetical protein
MRKPPKLLIFINLCIIILILLVTCGECRKWFISAGLDPRWAETATSNLTAILAVILAVGTVLMCLTVGRMEDQE